MAKEYFIEGKRVIGWARKPGGKPYPILEKNNTPLAKYQDKLEKGQLTDEDYKNMLNDFESWYNKLDKKEIKDVLDKLQDHYQKTNSLDITKRNIQESNPLGEYINKELGYDKKPELIDEKDYFDVIKFRGKEIINYDNATLDENHWFRGVHGEDSKKYIQEFKTGKFFAGEGYDMNGSYFSKSHWEALSNTGNPTDESNLIYAMPKKTANILKYSKLGNTNNEVLSKIDWNKYMNEQGELFTTFADKVIGDNGYFASLMGYDIIDFKGYDDRIVILNRSAIKVVK